MPVVVKEAMGGEIRVAFIRPPEGEVELIQPLDESTFFGEALREWGQGVHHIALRRTT